LEHGKRESFEFCHFEEHTRREIFTISDISRFLPEFIPSGIEDSSLRSE